MACNQCGQRRTCPTLGVAEQTKGSVPFAAKRLLGILAGLVPVTAEPVLGILAGSGFVF